MKIQPAPGHVLILPIPDEERKGSIILDVKTVRSLNPYVRGVVMCKGSPTKHYDLKEFKQNAKEIVMYPRSAGTEVDFDGVKYRIVHASEILLYWETLENR